METMCVCVATLSPVSSTIHPALISIIDASGLAHSSAFYYLCLKQLAVYPQRSYSHWECALKRERERKRVSGGYWGSLSPWQLVSLGKKNLFSVRQQSFITQKKNCSTHRRPQKARARLTSDPNNGAKESVVNVSSDIGYRYATITLRCFYSSVPFASVYKTNIVEKLLQLPLMQTSLLL